MILGLLRFLCLAEWARRSLIGAEVGPGLDLFLHFRWRAGSSSIYVWRSCGGFLCAWEGRQFSEMSVDQSGAWI